MTFKKYFALFFILIFALPGLPQFFHKNSANSSSVGKVNNGSIKNAWLLPYKGDNFKSFSTVSYFLLGRAYIHSEIYKTITESYAILDKSHPQIKFRYMECSKKKGGRARPHHTHQNGTSADFMTPLLKNNKPYRFYDRIGILRYGMNFKNNGRAKINDKICIDFETMALHILTLDKTGEKHHVRVKKVILNTNLSDELFATKYGPELKARGIYFTKNLSPFLNKLHDDHYHIDFEITD